MKDLKNKYDELFQFADNQYNPDGILFKNDTKNVTINDQIRKIHTMYGLILDFEKSFNERKLKPQVPDHRKDEKPIFKPAIPQDKSIIYNKPPALASSSNIQNPIQQNSTIEIICGHMLICMIIFIIIIVIIIYKKRILNRKKLNNRKLPQNSKETKKYQKNINNPKSIIKKNAPDMEQTHIYEPS